MAMRAAARVQRDNVCKKHGPSARSRPPDGPSGTVKLASGYRRKDGRYDTIQSLSDRVTAAAVASRWDLSGIRDEYLANTVATATTSNGGPSKGGGKEWLGPTWQFTEHCGLYGALMNLLGNAELMTPIGKKRERFVPDPDYCGEGLSPPQHDHLHCAINNVLDLSKALDMAREKAVKATYHSQRGRTLHTVEDRKQASPPSSLPSPTRDVIRRKQQVLQDLHLRVNEEQGQFHGPPKPAENDDTYTGDTVGYDFHFLGVDFALALQLNGVAYLSPCTQIALTGHGMVEILHRLENGCLWYKEMSEYALQELIDMRVGHLTEDSFSSDMQLQSAVAEEVLQIPTERKHELMAVGLVEMERHWNEWQFSRIHHDLGPVKYLDEYGRTSIIVPVYVAPVEEDGIPVLHDMIEDTSVVYDGTLTDVHVSELSLYISSTSSHNALV